MGQSGSSSWMSAQTCANTPASRQQARRSRQVRPDTGPPLQSSSNTCQEQPARRNTTSRKKTSSSGMRGRPPRRGSRVGGSGKNGCTRGHTTRAAAIQSMSASSPPLKRTLSRRKGNAVTPRIQHPDAHSRVQSNPCNEGRPQRASAHQPPEVSATSSRHVHPVGVDSPVRQGYEGWKRGGS